MSHLARALVLAVALGMLAASPAHAGTIVFDFEDGLQGWELTGAVQRVQTQLLGGEWAIFGDGFLGGSLSIHVDLTDIVSISLERSLVDGDEDGLAVFLAGSGPAGQMVGFSEFDAVEPGNPNLVASDLASFTSFWRVEIRWFNFPTLTSVAFIDNITFHTIPEPSVLGMLVVGGVAVLARRRAQGVRHM